MEKRRAFEALLGATTEIWALPADAKRAVEITAVSFVPLTNVVVRFAELPERFHTTTSPEAKFDPVTGKATLGAAIVSLVGEIETIEGAGGGAGSSTGTELPPPQPPRLNNSVSRDRLTPQAFFMAFLLTLPRQAQLFSAAQSPKTAKLVHFLMRCTNACRSSRFCSRTQILIADSHASLNFTIKHFRLLSRPP